MVHLNVSLLLAAIAVAPVLANYSSKTTVHATSSNVSSGNSANSSGTTKAIPAEDEICKQDAEMPDTCDGSNGWYPLSVVGREGYYCTQGPICTGVIGNCPGPHSGLIYGSTCVSLSEGTNGCVPNTECPTTGSTKFKEATWTASSIADNCMAIPDKPSHKLSSGKSEDATTTPPQMTAQSTLQAVAPATTPPTLDETLFVAQTPATVSPALEETPFIAQTPTTVPPTSTESGTFSFPLTIETESPTEVSTPYATSKLETQSASDGGLKGTQWIVNAGALTDVLTSNLKTLMPNSEDTSARSKIPYDTESSEGPLASTDTKASYSTLTDAIETKALAPAVTEIDAPETDALDSDAPDSDAPEADAPEIGVLTISTLDARRLRRT